MSDTQDYLILSDEQLLRQCRMDVTKASGPGGQHRNKVSTAIRLVHLATGITAHGNESRSQKENKQAALRRLRMHLACQVRKALPTSPCELPAIVQECLIRSAQTPTSAPRRLRLGRRDRRFWPVAAFVLDCLEALEGRLSDTAHQIGIRTANLGSFLKTDRHLWAAAQDIRRRFGRKPLT